MMRMIEFPQTHSRIRPGYAHIGNQPLEAYHALMALTRTTAATEGPQ